MGRMILRYAMLKPAPTYSMMDMADKYLQCYADTWAKNDMYCTILNQSVKFVALPQGAHTAHGSHRAHRTHRAHGVHREHGAHKAHGVQSS